MIQPIETSYAGCRFRSRLEARWAVFFDCLDIAWEYEPEGYALDDETWYLPDFLLPTFHRGVWCEIKPCGGDFSLAQRFSEALQVPMWLCEGTPDLRPYTVLFWDLDPGRLVEVECAPKWKDAAGENRFFTDTDDVPREISNPSYIHAIEQARSARFADKTIRYKPLSGEGVW